MRLPQWWDRNLYIIFGVPLCLRLTRDASEKVRDWLFLGGLNTQALIWGRGADSDLYQPPRRGDQSLRKTKLIRPEARPRPRGVQRHEGALVGGPHRCDRRRLSVREKNI